MNVAVIPYWIDIKNSETIEKKGTVTLGFLGRLNVNKGIEDLLNALNSDQLKALDFKLMIGGSGTEEYLEKLRNIPSIAYSKNTSCSIIIISSNCATIKIHYINF